MNENKSTTSSYSSNSFYIGFFVGIVFILALAWATPYSELFELETEGKKYQCELSRNRFSLEYKYGDCKKFVSV